MDKRVLFCNVGYLQYYDADLDTKHLKNGGAFVDENKTGGEINNFHKYEDGKCYGFVEPGFKNKKQNTIHIEKIDIDYKDKDEIPDVTVIFCAKSTIKQKTVIVGWYKNATVFRRAKETNGVKYNITANGSDTERIPESERKFEVPRANSAEKFGFGISQMWYAKEDNEKVKNFLSNVFKYIGGRRFIWTEQDDKEYLESGISKKADVNVYGRNSAAREACLNANGYNCKICGFESKKVYGEGFEHLIHVHHIKPISEQGREYPVNPETDLIPVCPNCHMALHTNVNGKYLTPSELKEKLEKL